MPVSTRKRPPLGVMQGRLLPKYQGRYQAHPVGYWQKEFHLAADLGLDCIEFILDFNDASENPLMTKKGVEEILTLGEATGVTVLSVCADYFMEAPLHSDDSEIVTESRKVLQALIENGKELKLTDIVMPCVDQSSLKTAKSAESFYHNLVPFLDSAEKHKINISLETDLAPEPFAELIRRFDSRRVTVNYDIGNSAALGYDTAEELKCYGDKISDIHIKDRLLGGGPVPLGTGNAKFDDFFAALKPLNYAGHFIMQAYRDDEGIEIFKQQLNWLRERKYLE
mgnify:CR=1 FL=1